MTKIIGLTGGIGSGKTTIAAAFEKLGAPVYIADDAAKKIMQTDEMVQSIKKHFGNEMVNQNKIDRQKLAAVVFGNPEKLHLLNQIVHPLVQKDFEQWVKSHQDFPFIIKEAAILFESGSYKDCDKIITITAPLETRIQRVIRRDKSTIEAVLERVKNQWTDEMRIAKSDYIIHNISLEDTILQINKIYKLLTNL